MKFLTTKDRMVELLAITLYEHNSIYATKLPWSHIDERTREYYRKVARGEEDF